MCYHLTREEIAILIQARKINNCIDLPRHANVTTICNLAGISRKTGYQWASKMEKQILNEQRKTDVSQASNRIDKHSRFLKNVKARGLLAKQKLKFYHEFIQSRNRTELAQNWGIDRSYVYEIAAECDQALLDSLAYRELGRKPRGMPSTFEEACYRTEALEAKIARETIQPNMREKDKWKINCISSKDRERLFSWRKSNDRRKWRKAVVVLENANLGLEELSIKIECPIQTIKLWIKSYNQLGLEGLEDKRKNRDVRKFVERSEIRTHRIIEFIHQNPKTFGINRSNWTQTSLATAYETKYGERFSTKTIGKLIRKSGYSIKRARKVLTSPDPDYKEKVELLLKTLWSLKPDEMFFFVDELGPLQIKKYGGKGYFRKEDRPTVPQKQISKGSITLCGALSATTNQISWFYSKSKDTSSTIDLIEILFNQHHDKSKIYITWDAASWHRSNALVDWLDKFNTQTEKKGEGPKIDLVPLPSSAQFLDVIEAVFSGMKRAVIHHSNYQSEDEMKAVISRHFQERNDYFKSNPKRAGKKIWEIDFFQDYDNLKSGNYREW